MKIDPPINVSVDYAWRTSVTSYPLPARKRRGSYINARSIVTTFRRRGKLRPIQTYLRGLAPV